MPDKMRRLKVTLDDGDIAGIAFGDALAPLDVLFLHANGFNGVTYQSILQPLGAGAHVAAIDLRGHGRTTLPADPDSLFTWNRFRDDVIEFIEKTAPQGLVLGGHSMGGTTSLLVAAKRPDLVKGLVLADPVLMRPSRYRLFHLPLINKLVRMNPLSRQAARRRREFSSPEEAEERLKGRGAFKSWRDPFLQDYLVDGLRFVSDQNYELSCAPEWESACFSAQRNQPWGAFRRLKKHPEIPIVILQAQNHSTSAPETDQRVHAVRPDAAVTRVPGTTHFMPMERPYVVREALEVLHRNQRDDLGDELTGAVRRTISDAIGVME